ncbi:manganese/zinc/iron transport system permease protein [Bacillus ectoiniformans]|uniref:metal ABC transporter permease n=1 Tax=Bacillus ectoiniformans TaxID=1494429 RepID=UPI0019574B3C|nr:metal ABC transporter permease [Bacillus ectoiniformans]MBM7649175.1 manganese/zinc/iron transport system permease protein [Bacillus ectoiniformans]
MDATIQWVLTGSLLLGLASGVLGSFALLRKQSLIGDAMAHATLPGICLAFLVTGEKSLPLFLISAAVSGLLATYCIQAITKHSRIKEDTSIGLVLSVFFGFGIVLLTKVSQSSSGNKSGLNDFIFGQAASMVGEDVKLIMIAAIVLLTITFLLFKELKLLTFDPAFAQGLGLPSKTLNLLLMTMITFAVVIGIQMVGVVLMAAMLITPAISARYWTERLDHMVVISGMIGAISGAAGSMASTYANGLPTGPLIVLAATGMFIISLLFAPKRGLLMKAWRHYQLRDVTAREQLFVTLYNLSEDHYKDDSGKFFSIQEISARRSISPKHLAAVLGKMKQEGMVHSSGNNEWKLTNKGLKEAHRIVYNHRLMEVFLMNETKFSGHGISYNQRADIEDWPESVKQELKSLLEEQGRTPFLLSRPELAWTKQTETAGGTNR